MKVMVIGAGRIGRGLLAKLLSDNQCQLVFFDQDETLIASLNQSDSYQVHVLGHPQKKTTIDHYRAFDMKDIDQLARSLSEVDFVFTAVGGKYLNDIAVPLAKALVSSPQRKPHQPLNFVTCENWLNAGATLEAAIKKQFALFNQTVDQSSIGFSEAVILTTGTGSPDAKNTSRLDTWIENRLYLPIDKSRIVGLVPSWGQIEFIDQYHHLLKQKLYTNNMSVALIAYLGVLKGYRYVAEAANDVEIEVILDQAYKEVDATLIKALGIDDDVQKTFSNRAKAKYQDPVIVDELHRIARDPLRKLSFNDRLIGPAMLAYQNHIEPVAIAKGIVAAIYYDNPNDQSAMILNQILGQGGLEMVLDQICQIPAHHPLRDLIKKTVFEFTKRGWIDQEQKVES